MTKWRVLKHKSKINQLIRNLSKMLNLYNNYVINVKNVHAGATLKSQLLEFLSSCLHWHKISKIWRRALVVTITKRIKPVGDPKSYRPIFLLCVPYKIFERLIYARVEPIIDPLVLKEQPEFQCGKSALDQVVLLTENIKDFFVNLSIWRRHMTLYEILACWLRLLPDKHMVWMIMELVQTQSFTLTTGDSKQSKIRPLKNGVPLYIYVYIFPSQFPESLPTKTIWHSCTLLETGRPLRGLVTVRRWRQHFI